MRRSLVWVSALPLMLAGSQVAHVLVYRWVYPASQVRLHALLSSGHGYLNRLPLVFGIAGSVALVSLLVGVVDAARGRPVRGLPAWAFALLPLTAFVLQEILERSLHAGVFVWQAVESPTFVPGLLLQLPFAAVAYALAHLLLRVTERAGRALALGPPRPAHAVSADLPLPLSELLPRERPLACRLAGRGPPHLLLA
jgi:hypothetical protein